jgi:putative transposase
MACVVMPDHVHWLLQLSGQLSLSQVMRHFKGLASHEINLLKDSRAPVWQKGFHDHALRSDESLERVARYIVENPLRAGLVKQLADYPLWHCAWDLSG